MKRLSAGAAAFAAAGMLVLLYAAVLSFFVRLASGLLLTALLGAVLLLTGMFYKPLKKRKWPLGLLCAAYALLLAFVLFPALYSRNDTVTYDEDVLIVLGAGLDGEAVTPQLENRLDALRQAKYRIGRQGQSRTLQRRLELSGYIKLSS